MNLPSLDTKTQEQADAALGRRIRELVCDLGQPVYIPPTEDIEGEIQIVVLDEVPVLDQNSIYFGGAVYPVNNL